MSDKKKVDFKIDYDKIMKEAQQKAEIEIIEGLKYNILETIKDQVTDHVASEMQRFMKEDVMPLVKEELPNLKAALVKGLLPSFNQIGKDMGKTFAKMTAESLTKANGYTIGDMIAKIIKGY